SALRAFGIFRKSTARRQDEVNVLRRNQVSICRVRGGELQPRSNRVESALSCPLDLQALAMDIGSQNALQAFIALCRQKVCSRPTQIKNGTTPRQDCAKLAALHPADFRMVL